MNELNVISNDCGCDECESGCPRGMLRNCGGDGCC